MKTIGFTFLALIFVGNIHAQELFSGVVTYRMSMGGASATTYTTYYRAGDQLTDMPHSKMKTLYLAKEKTMYTVMGMMGKPIVSSRSFDPDTMEVPLFDVAGFANPVAWTFTATNTGGKDLRLREEDGKLMLDLLPGGLTVIFR